MKIINEKELKALVAEEGYLLKSKDDEYKESYIDEFGNQMREHIPHFFKKAYVPESMTIEKAEKIYEELKEGDVKVGKN